FYFKPDGLFIFVHGKPFRRIRDDHNDTNPPPSPAQERPRKGDEPGCAAPAWQPLCRVAPLHAGRGS
ncbi:MAG: hypothetical protein PHF64_11835, partial [Methanoregula sp.]|nr:hypothetical protein [Methanoregula sp.]